MRHVGDTLVWLGLMLMVAAVIYFTPQVADYVSSMAADRGHEAVTYRELALHHHGGASHSDR
jgi:hypothetical protein